MQRLVKVRSTWKAMLRARENGMADHREFVRALFEEKGFIVIKFEELRFHYPERATTPFTIEGTIGKSIISKDG